VALVLGGLAAAGCTVGPSYAPPAPPQPSAPRFIGQSAAFAPTAEGLDQWWRLYKTPALDQLVAQALSNNKNLLTAEANLRYARAALSLARSQRLPSTQISSGANYGVSTEQLIVQDLEGGKPSPTGYFTLGLDASYEVDLFGRIHRAVQAASADFQAQQAAEDVTRISVAGETTRAFLNACAYAEEVAVAQQSVTLVDQTLDVTLKEEQFGAASAFDVARARQAVEQTRAAVPAYEAQRRVALFELAVLTGRPPEEINQDADQCKSPPKLTMLAPIGDVQSLFKRRPDVRQAERQLAGNVARIGVATADLYPSITLGASVSSASPTVGGLFNASGLTYAIGPGLSWTFPNTTVALAEIRQAKATASASYANFQASVLQALQDTEEALAVYSAELDRNRALTAAKNQSQLAFTLAQTEFGGGSASYLDVLTAQSNLVDSLMSLAASDELIASDQVTLFKALGGGWEQAPKIEALPIIDGRTHKAIAVK
jgi:NodT family efflux transporter outer membrane factor (OMF) lipoprotein